MKGWCKIIELDTHDVVVERFYDEEEGECVRVMAQDDIGMFITTVAFKTPEESLEFFNMVDEKIARNVLINLLEQKEDDPFQEPDGKSEK